MVGTREVKIEAVIERVRRNRCWSPGPPKAPPPSSLEPHRLNQEGKLLPNCSWRHIFSHYHTRNHHQRNSSNAGHHANFWKRSAWLHGQVLVEVLTGPHVWRHCSGVEEFARSQKRAASDLPCSRTYIICTKYKFCVTESNLCFLFTACRYLCSFH